MTTVLHHTQAQAMDNLRVRFQDVDFVAIPTKGELPADARGDVLLTTAVGGDTLEEALTRGVKWVHVYGTGLDRFPVEAVGADQVLTCSRGASAIPIAEWTLSMMLAFEKHIPECWITAPLEPPRRWNLFDNGGLYGETLAIVGLGAIGIEVAKRALAFGMQIQAMRRTSAPAPIDGISMFTELGDVLAGARHVVLAAPLTRRTRHLIDASAFAAMSPGTHLVNIARGGLVDQDALRVALGNETVAMASLDTVDPEPLPDHHWLYDHPRVRLSPHISWCMPMSGPLLYQTFGDNLARWMAGEPLEGLVNRDERY